eukprot:GEMP01055572.1.p1 GENE.GEMP01055572.1~~GEMP01055572.1.p1  ORF type:complete len:330 (+),score=67.07 GEMP01055572.1:36-1025(+)
MGTPIIVSVEAPIASGKSTLLSLVQEVLGKSVYIVQEPVAEWQAILGNPEHNMLELFYGDLTRWSYSFQSHVFVTRVMSVENAIKTLEAEGRLDDTVILVERSYYSDKETFARIGLENGHFSAIEWAMYESWWNWLVQKAPVFSGHVYMATSLDTIMKRLGIRNRGEESGVTSDFQRKLLVKHEQWVATQQQNGVPVLVVNAEVDFLSNSDELDIIIGQLADFFATLRSPLRVAETRPPATPQRSTRGPVESSPEKSPEHDGTTKKVHKTRSNASLSKSAAHRRGDTAAAERLVESAHSTGVPVLKMESDVGKVLSEASTCVCSTDDSD